MNILKPAQLVAVALVSLLVIAPSGAQNQGAKVNGVAIPQTRIELLVKNAVAQGQTDSPELRNQIREELITREILLQEATKKGVDKNPDIAAQLEIQRQTILINAFLQDYVKSHSISAEAMKKEYDSAKDKAGGAKEYKVRHILVKQEDEAKQIIVQLKKGASFDKLAAEKSEDSGSKNKGGDLDWSPAGRYVKPFAEALPKLKKGQLTETPVQSPFGWHVIRLDDERPIKIPSFDDARNTIQQQMQNQAVQKYIAELRAKAKIE